MPLQWLKWLTRLMAFCRLSVDEWMGVLREQKGSREAGEKAVVGSPAGMMHTHTHPHIRIRAR
jgi:hypothetical protein